MNSTAIRNTTELTASGSHNAFEPVIRQRYFYIIAVYCVILMVSLVGNSLVLAVVYRNKNKRMRTTINYFIFNMSCSDLLITVCNIPLLITQFASANYIQVGGTIGTLWCKLTTLLFYVSVEVSLLSLGAITVDRFLLVFYPLKTFITVKRARIIIGTIWLTGTIFTAPLAAQTTLLEYRHFKVCSSSLSKNAIRAYSITGLVVFVVLPLTTVVVLYSSTVVKLFRQKTPGQNPVVIQEHSNKRNRKVLLMLVTVVTITVVCWLPYWLAYINCIMTSAIAFCNSLLYLQVLAFANCALNPCAYVIFNKSFRVEFYQILCIVFCRSCFRSNYCQHQVFPNDFVFSKRKPPASRA